MALKILRDGAAFRRSASLNNWLLSAWNDFEIAAWNGTTIKLGTAGASDHAIVWVFGGNCNRHDLYYLGIWLPGRESKKELLNYRLKLSCYVMYHQDLHSTIPLSVHTAVFMCFVRISEQTAIISLYSINRLSFITETERVYCGLRAGT